MFTYFLHLGSNVGDRKKMLFQAIQHIQVQIGKVVIQSSVYETEPWGLTDQANFYNMAVKVHSTKNPEQVCLEAKAIEKEMQRIKELKWGPRNIDIDLLYCDDIILQTETLTIPHPQIYNRNFVLIPMMEIAGEWMDPVKNMTITELYDQCQDTNEVFILNE
ncbi:MAG TPA: 2-amino-4-hydroxy-6-hydroxymethyldihydropteridine diphosphokinase [Saprospiraceae bacterium]|nr:2-amino-4-hydroxy-6-hydroxymethyldihydropteridine diphosphokinase [Saprospiraceae bacterium]HRP42424.1 2-amino-4-hydroxy-6-hydroxymethyldihydropteridine diphosphokinase [Saprospiraceae bacterium]